MDEVSREAELESRIQAVIVRCKTWDSYTRGPSPITTIPIYKALGIWDESTRTIKEFP